MRKQFERGQQRAPRWQTIEDLRPYLQPIVDELSRMPNTPELKARGRNDLITAIVSFGGFATVAQALGYVYRGPASWEQIEDLRLHLDPIVLQLGRMPTNTELKARNRVDLTGAIRKFGGYPQAAKVLGYPYTPRHAWNSIEDLRPHLDPIVEELGHMPTQTELNERDLGYLIGVIRKFKGTSVVAQSLGYLYEGRNFYESVEDLRPQLQPIVDELGRMPSQQELKSRGRYALTGIVHRFGGQLKVAQLLGYPYRRSRWKRIEDLRPQLDPIVEELGHMPTQQELEKRGRADLRGAIERFEGRYAVAEALGYPYEERNTWKEVEDLRPHLKPIVDKLERMPTQADLHARGCSYLINAIKKFGGLAEVAELLGYQYTFAPEHERHDRVKKLEEALLQLHQAQQLSAGQVMLVLRHAGVLSKQQCMRTIRRLQASTGKYSTDIQAVTTMTALDDFDEEDSNRDELICETGNGGDLLDASVPDPEANVPRRREEDGQVETGDDQRRNRIVEIKELCGWSAVGNLLDPTPALIQLSVTRLKTAFYQFANFQRGSLDAPHQKPSLEEVERLKMDLWKAAFGEYEELINNELIHEACQTYTENLAEALLFPRTESKKAPRLYQLDGGRFLAQRLCSETQPYGLLFDQPGMGKTLTLLWALAAASVQRFIVVAPLTVKTQVWTFAELQVAFPHLEKAHVARGLDAALDLPKHGAAIVLLHYEELRRHDDVKRLAAPLPDGLPPFEVLVFDEAHTVKERLVSGHSEQRAGAWFLRKGARACIGLTATPVVNELYEPVSLLHLVQGQRENTAGRRLQSRRLRDRVDVMEYLLADSLRRLKSDVLFEIPPRQIDPYLISPTVEQLEKILHFLSRGRRAVGMALTEYRRLMLECKLEWIVDRVRACSVATASDGVADPKVLILCCNVEGISNVVFSRLLSAFGPEHVAHIHGTTPQKQREDTIEQFRKDGSEGCRVLIGTVGTIGVGVTLFDPGVQITPHRVIFADLPFTWAEFEQGVDRLHRVGQRYPVQVDVPLVSYSEQLTRADGVAVRSFDEWVWEWISRKRVLADQVLDADFDITGYKDVAIRRAISQALKDIEQVGGTLIAPLPPPDSASAEHRRLLGRYRGLPRQRVAEFFQIPGASEQFLTLNDASSTSKLAQRLVSEHLGRWLDKRSVVVDLGCGSNQLRGLPCAQVIGIDRHGINGSLIGDSAATGLPSEMADFVVFSLSMWGTSYDRLCYLQEAKRLLRPIGKLIIVEPIQTVGGIQAWKIGVERLKVVLEKLGMQVASANDHIVDTGTRLVTIVANNSNDIAVEDISSEDCIWADIE